MSEPAKGVPPYRIGYSGRCREATRQLLVRAMTTGLFAQIAQAVRELHRRLEWIPLDFGEPLKDLVQLGIQIRVGTVPPLVVRYGVDEERRIVHVGLPFDLLPNSGL